MRYKLLDAEISAGYIRLEQSDQSNNGRENRDDSSGGAAEGRVGKRLRGRRSLTNVVQRSHVHGGVELLVLRTRRQTVGLGQVEGETLAAAESVKTFPFNFDGGTEDELSIGVNVDGEHVVGGLTDGDDELEALRGSIVGGQSELIGVGKSSVVTGGKERARSAVRESVGNVSNVGVDNGSLAGPDSGQEESSLSGQESSLGGGVGSILVDSQSTAKIDVEANDLAEVFGDDLGGNQGSVGVGIQGAESLITTANNGGGHVVVSVQFASGVGDDDKTDQLGARSVKSVGAVDVSQRVVRNQGRRNLIDKKGNISLEYS
jgi:hypothetical protein